MDYEKKYKDALERAKKVNDGNDVDVTAGTTVCEYIFPELKESEDEEIRKGLIKAFGSIGKKEWGGVNVKNAIAWLEMQGEQKPTNKVEPKFKVGDWVVYCGKTCKITGLHNGIFTITNQDGSYFFNQVESTTEPVFHLWTVQDAKDGDVLYFNNELTNYHLIGIFKRIAANNSIYSGTYLCYVRYGGFKGKNKLEVTKENCELHHCGTTACPATKEQRELLFKVMYDAGYVWDAEKKELREIEQKPTWSEEDDAYKLFAISAVEDYYDEKNPLQKELVDWLKSLKERIK